MDHDPFFASGHFEQAAALRTLGEALHGTDDGELYLEQRASESYMFDDGRLKQASGDTSQGFGLRAVRGETTAYAHSAELSDAALKRAAATVCAVDAGQPNVRVAIAPAFGTNRQLYTQDNPIAAVAFAQKLAVLQAIDGYLRAADPRVRQVSATLAANWQRIRILRADGQMTGDVRPLVRLSVQVVIGDGTKMESGSSGAGGRILYDALLAEEGWKPVADEALRQARVNLAARPAPAGELPVVLGAGWCGVLLHEAVGHGLEGDFNRKGSSAFAGRMGEQVAARGVTVVDDGTLAQRRGSLSVDDEGTPTQRNVLIEDGVLKGYLHDRLNARLTGVAATGNGRRESYAHAPLPRMTNTFMLGGNAVKEEMISSVTRGIYAAYLGGGQVDITSGKFVFNATEAYMIEDGKITFPIKGATLIGSGPEVMGRIAAIGNDMALDPGVGTCGKAGQSVPVGVGQPSLLISGMTVGGTQL
ncbi:MAG: metalloprotease TldD [Alphaproteobacteria bacterium]|nr:metalloprotease TldD [Alphaproteobacteria bacterium]